MRCPKAVINLFAESLRMKAIESEEYIDENETPLKPNQLERLQRMTRSMKDRCREKHSGNMIPMYTMRTQTA